MCDCDRCTNGCNSVRSTQAAIVLAAAILTGCGGGGTGPTPPPPPPAPVAVTSITIAPDTTVLVPGGTRQFIAIARDEAGNALTDRTVTWAATTLAATVSTSGLVTARSLGTGYITATSEGLETHATFTVIDGAAIGANGGAVTAAAGAAALTVPAGALTQSTTITIQPEGTPPTSQRLVPGTAYAFGPNGTTFMQPVTIKLQYGALAAANKDQSRLRLHRYVNSAWVEVPGSTVNVVERTVTGQASSFSTYAILELPSASQPSLQLYR